LTGLKIGGHRGKVTDWIDGCEIRILDVRRQSMAKKHEYGRSDLWLEIGY